MYCGLNMQMSKSSNVLTCKMTLFPTNWMLVFCNLVVIERWSMLWNCLECCHLHDNDPKSILEVRSILVPEPVDFFKQENKTNNGRNAVLIVEGAPHQKLWPEYVHCVVLWCGWTSTFYDNSMIVLPPTVVVFAFVLVVVVFFILPPPVVFSLFLLLFFLLLLLLLRSSPPITWFSSTGFVHLGQVVGVGFTWCHV